MAEIALESVVEGLPGRDARGPRPRPARSQDGEFVVFVGPSGCGKTSALRMIAGLEDITEGTIRIGDEVVNDLPPKDRDVAMIFQNYALYPHMSAYDNMAFALKMRGVDRRRDRPARATTPRRVLGLEDVLRKKPRTLSGGQRQRVAMGRAIVREPRAFLMDEPLSNLDAKLRVQMRAEIARLQRDLERDDDLRHARPDRGDDARRPRRRDAQGRAAAARHAAGRSTAARSTSSSRSSSARRR